ncbi:MAG: hypothetical protein Q9201_002014 [Fulgogasparrea decipioides]
MPDRPLTVLTYAASASLAAVALVYFFNPNQFIDGESSTSSSTTRKNGIVGLVNPANDCFINSVLQSLAGLGDLRLYLIREVHRRDLDDGSIYMAVPEKDEQGKEVVARKRLSLQGGEVTRGLKCMLDQLNERPIYKKTISAQSFINVLENAFGTRISRAQQDAQELLQLVAERLNEEYDAGKRARQRARKELLSSTGGHAQSTLNPKAQPSIVSAAASDLFGPICAADEGISEEEDGFPLQGQTEARVECQHCHFAPKPAPSRFVMLNLMVPQKGTATLNECFDGHFKTEYIEDYTCDRCRLDHAIETLDEEMMFARSQEQQDIIQAKIDLVRKAIEVDPEQPPDRIQLPDAKHAPKRKIARHVQMTKFPKVLVIHLSRSMFDPGSYSQKNTAKLSFPERLPIGGILNRKNYKLLGLVTHRGTHNSGHYETFRRQHLYPPRSTPHTEYSAGPYSPSATPNPSNQPSPRMSGDFASTLKSTRDKCVDQSSTEHPSISAAHSSAASTETLSPPLKRPTSGSIAAENNADSLPKATVPTRLGSQDQPTAILSAPLKTSPSTPNLGRYAASLDLSRFRRKKRTSDRWWRISDDTIKECNTTDVLAMQKDAYMLFYEMERNQTVAS